jgi:hypothetical protein
MTAVYMNPDAAVPIAQRMADVAAELEERAAVIDRLLDEAGRSSAAPAQVRTSAELVAAVSLEIKLGAALILSADGQAWPQIVIDLILGAMLTATVGNGPRSLEDILHDYQVADDEVVDWEPPFPASLFTEPTRVTRTEAGLLDSLSLLNQRDFKDVRDDAFSRAEDRYPGTTPRDSNDGHQDAFRHAYWNARLVHDFGSDFARKFATAHEGLPGNPADREAMDLYNNEVGRRVATENPDAGTDELADLIQQAVEGGDLIVIDRRGELAHSDQVSVGQHGQADDPPARGGRPAEPAGSEDAYEGSGS